VRREIVSSWLLSQKCETVCGGDMGRSRIVEHSDRTLSPCGQSLTVPPLAAIVLLRYVTFAAQHVAEIFGYQAFITAALDELAPRLLLPEPLDELLSG
jgi:hypothetical protein